MNREIKFRGKQLEYHQPWIYGQLITDERGKAYILDKEDFSREIVYDVEPDNDVSFVIGLVEVDPNTVGQYTGLKDKNGTEIYEGDVVEDYGDYMGVVYYDTQYAHYFILNEASGESLDFVGVDFREVKVVGNIHDNPELIE